MSEEVTFTRGAARRPMPQVADPMIQWATGLPTNDRRIYAGWLVECGRSDTLDAAMEQTDFQTITIKHGSGNLVTHWSIPTARLFVVAEGMQSIGEMKHTEERHGIAFGWRTLDGGRQQSVLRCRVFLRDLLQAGYTEPLLLSLKSTLTGDFLRALAQQYTVLDALKQHRIDAKRPQIELPFYCCSIAIGPGAEVARGSGNQTREISPPIAHIPSDLMSKAGKEYIAKHWIKREWVGIIEGMLDDTIRWSKDTSALISAGEEPRQEYE